LQGEPTINPPIAPKTPTIHIFIIFPFFIYGIVYVLSTMLKKSVVGCKTLKNMVVLIGFFMEHLGFGENWCVFR